jgi:hypothetical protein
MAIENTIIPALFISQKKKIKKIVKFYYGIDANDYDINWIDKMLRNHYLVFHNQNIIRNIVTVNIDKILLKHRDRIGSLKFEEITLEKLIFHYLRWASMSFRAGVPIGSIFLCRTAIETGLRERIAEEIAQKEIKDMGELPQKIWELMKKLKNKKLWELIKIAEDKNIITEKEIEKFFEPLRLEEQRSRKIFNKFIHGEISWIVKFVETKAEGYAKVIGAKDILEEKKIIAEFSLIDYIAIGVLIGTTLVAERLYFKCI